jgi:hypothetical protein
VWYTYRDFGVRDALRLIVSEHGEAALSDPRLMTILLGDCLQEYPADQALLAAAAQEDLPGKLREHLADGTDLDAATAAVAAGFGQSTGHPENACAWVVTQLAVALGLREPPAPETPQQFHADPAPAHVERRAEFRLRLPAARALLAAWDVLAEIGWRVEGTAVSGTGPGWRDEGFALVNPPAAYTHYIRVQRSEVREFADHLESISGSLQQPGLGGRSVGIEVRVASTRGSRDTTTIKAVVEVVHFGSNEQQDELIADQALGDFITRMSKPSRLAIRWRRQGA